MESYGPAQPLFLSLVVFLALSWTTALLRGFVKIVIVKKVTIDDYMMFGAMIVYTGYTAAGLVGVVDGPGNPGIGLTPASVAVTLRSWWICEALYSLLTLLGRMSVAVFMLRMASHKVHRHVIIGVMATFWLVTIPLFAVLIFQCRPISYFWTQVLPKAPHGSCISNAIVVPITEMHSAVSACCDCILGMMPMVMLWKVKLNKQTKLTLSLLLGLGCFAGIALIIRLYYVHRVGMTNTLNEASIKSACWSIIEPGVCIIAGCVATLRPLFSRSIRTKQANWAAQAKSAREAAGHTRQRGHRHWNIRTMLHGMRGAKYRRSDREDGLLQSPAMNGNEDLELQDFERNRTCADEKKGQNGQNVTTSTGRNPVDVDVAKPAPAHQFERVAYDITDTDPLLQCAVFPLPPRSLTHPRLRSLQDMRRERMTPVPGQLRSPHTFPLSFLPLAVQPLAVQTGRNFTRTAVCLQENISSVNSHGVPPNSPDNAGTQRKLYVVDPDLEAWFGLE